MEGEGAGAKSKKIFAPRAKSRDPAFISFPLTSPYLHCVWSRTQRSLTFYDDFWIFANSFSQDNLCPFLVHLHFWGMEKWSKVHSKKATKFCEISTVDLSYVVPVQSTVEISQNFVAFSEYMNFKGGLISEIFSLWLQSLKTIAKSFNFSVLDSGQWFGTFFCRLEPYWKTFWD